VEQGAIPEPQEEYQPPEGEGEAEAYEAPEEEGEAEAVEEAEEEGEAKALEEAEAYEPPEDGGRKSIRSSRTESPAGLRGRNSSYTG